MELRDRPARTRIEYPEQLAEEHALVLRAHPGLVERPLATIYFGGGTPSVLSPAAVGDLIRCVRARHGDSAAEITLEANPENLTRARCDAWREAGINRLSIGVQSFHERDLKRLERLHDIETIYRAVENARETGFNNLSIDLMFGLPDQTLDEWQDNLRRAAALQPEHLSFYGLTIHENTPFFDENRARRLALPGESIEAEMYLWGSSFLREHGYEHYEISNFARPERRSAHNQRYWLGEDVVGLGPGAHSLLDNQRWQNAENLDDWLRAICKRQLARSEPHLLGREEEIEETVFRRMRTAGGFSREGNNPADRLFFDWLQTPTGRAAAAQSWIDEDETSARLTTEGWLVSDALLLNMVKNIHHEERPGKKAGYATKCKSNS